MIAAGYPHNLDDIYAKHAADDQPSSRQDDKQSWLDALTRALFGSAAIGAGVSTTPGVAEKLVEPLTRDTIRTIAMRHNGQIEVAPRHQKHVPHRSEYKDIRAQHNKLIGRLWAAEPKGPKVKLDFRSLEFPGYNPFTDTIDMTTTKPEIAAHELGHRINAGTAKRLIGAKAYDRLFTYTRQHNIPGIAARIAAPFMLGSNNENVRHAAPWVMAASGIPVLTSELLASIRGMNKYYRKLGGRRPWSAAGGLGRAFGTYLAATALPALGAYGANKLNDLALNSNNETARRLAPPLMLLSGLALLPHDIRNLWRKRMKF